MDTRARARRAVIGLVVAALVAGTVGVAAAGASPASPAQAAPADPSATLSPVLAGLAGVPVDDGSEPGTTSAPSGSPAPAPAGSEADIDAFATAEHLPTDGAGSLIVRDGGRILVSIRTEAATPAMVAALTTAGAAVVHVSEAAATVTATVVPADLAALGTVPGVIYVEEVLTPMTGTNADPLLPADGDGAAVAAGEPAATTSALSCVTNPTGAFVSEADTQLRAAQIRAEEGIDGAGVRVGILSDSYDDIGGASADVASGELPGSANPCGYRTPVHVLQDISGEPGSDEGRAMAQLVHDLAPGSPISFSSAFNGEYDFADQIRALQADGASVIVDDVSYFAEPMFQDGPVATAVNDVTAAGVSYFSSAGNNNAFGSKPASSYEAPAFRPMTCPNLAQIPAGSDCHDFDPSAGTSNGNSFTMAARSQLLLTLGWNESLVGSDMDLLLYRPDTGQFLTQRSTNNLFLGGSNRASETLQYVNTSFDPLNVRLVVVRRPPTGGSVPSPRIKLIYHALAGSGVQWNTSTGGDVVGPTLFGHNGTTSAITVAAVPYNNPNAIEPYSSRGPQSTCWTSTESFPPSPITPCLSSSVDIAATDGVQNSFFGGGAPNRFYGTSAAAPHAAAVAALQLQQAPCRVGAPVVFAQRSTAVYTGYTGDVAGSGRLDAVGAVRAMAPCPGPEAGSAYTPVVPKRILDSREANGWSGTLQNGTPRDLLVTGLGGGSNVPTTATAVVLNVTVTEPTVDSFVSVWPAGATPPVVSSLNYSQRQSISNLVTVKIGSGGRVRFATGLGDVHVIADVVGYFGVPGGGGDLYNRKTPVRLLDSRIGQGWANALAPGEERNLVVTQQGGNPDGVPNDATAIVANVTVTRPTGDGFLAAWPAGQPRPTVASLNFRTGQTIPNLVMLKVGTGGAIRFGNHVGQTDVILDVVGYYKAGTGDRFHATDPTRILDSRFGKGLVGPWGANQARDLAVAGAPGTNVPAGATGLLANVTATAPTVQSHVTVYPSDLAQKPGVSNLNFLGNVTIPNLVAVGLPANGIIRLHNDLGQVHLIADVAGYFAPT